MSQMQVRVECGECGVVRVLIAELVVRLCTDNERWSYCFRCPECGLATAHDSDRETLDLLVGLGAPLERWRTPSELVEHRPLGPVFTLDDLLDFHLLMQRPDWFDVLQRTGIRA